MHPKYYPLYQDLMDELFQILQVNPGTLDTMDVGFHCCKDWWERLREHLDLVPFETEDEEILFFKYEKPRFTGLMEYFILRYQALLFLPEIKEDRPDYWKHELRKRDKFYKEYGAFCMYYKSGATYNDREWFIRRYDEEDALPRSRVYNQDLRASCPKDWELAMIGAYGWYAEYVQEQLVILEGQKSER